MSGVGAGSGAWSAETRLLELGISLPAPPAPVGAYTPSVRAGNSLVYLSGHVSTLIDSPCRGVVGVEVGLEEAVAAARGVGIALLGTLKAELGSLDAVERIVKVTGMVASAASFTAQTQVIDGASRLLVDVLGDAGRHARAAFGVVSLPGGASVEIDLIAQFRSGTAS